MNNRDKNKHGESSKKPEELETESLSNRSRQELIELAKNLSDGKYKKDSRQRENIMQLLVKQLSSSEDAK